jgi:hypothetical protein
VSRITFERPDPARRPYLSEYLSGRLYHLRYRKSGKLLTFGEYADHRIAGTWNELAEDQWPDRPGLLIPEEPDLRF